MFVNSLEMKNTKIQKKKESHIIGSKFYRYFPKTSGVINDRQRLMINKLMDGFYVIMNAQLIEEKS